MSMSRKDFESLARELRDQLNDIKAKHREPVPSMPGHYTTTYEGVVRLTSVRESAARVAKALKSTNPSFDAERFLHTVEPERNDAKTAG